MTYNQYSLSYFRAPNGDLKATKSLREVLQKSLHFLEY